MHTHMPQVEQSLKSKYLEEAIQKTLSIVLAQSSHCDRGLDCTGFVQLLLTPDDAFSLRLTQHYLALSV